MNIYMNIPIIYSISIYSHIYSALGTGLFSTRGGGGS